eukprot:GFUD01039385.1.p1 GENE.GFUD01039385.1~~GFUD01039385.1.p1  ORF type:complete len:862 (+),score=224.23 GFUD01039385.1:55-2640(+)
MANVDLAQLLERVRKNLRPTLISQKGGVSLERLNKDYSELMGEGIPFRQLQFQSMESFLRSIPDVCSVEWRGGELVVAGVADESTQHIVKMVRLQKTKTKRRKRGGGPTCPTRPLHRQSLTWGGGRRYTGRAGVGPNVAGYNGPRLNGPPLGGYQVRGSSSGTRGGRSGRVSVFERLGEVPRKMNGFQMTDVSNRSGGRVDSVSVGMKNLALSPGVVKETVGGSAVFGQRVEQLLEGRVYGLFSSQVEKMYEKNWEEVLPIEWCKQLCTRGMVRVEHQSGQTVVYSGTANLVSRATTVVPPATISTYPPPPAQYWSIPPPKISSSYTRETNPLPNGSPNLACSSLRNIYSQPPPFVSSPKTSRPSLNIASSKLSKSSFPPLSFPRSSNWDISVCLVTASNLVYFQFNDNMDKLEELVTAMDDFYASNSLPIRRNMLSPGQICCANVDDGFYRVKIIEIDETSCNCFFLDIGLENLVDSDDIQGLPPQFLQLPGQAVAACLAKVEHWLEEEVVEFVTKLLDGESFVALVDNREELGDWYMEEQVMPFLFLMDSNCSNMASEINKFIVKFSSKSIKNDTNNNNQDQHLLVSSSDLYPIVTSSNSPADSSSLPSQSNNSSLVTSSLIPEVSSSYLSSPEKSHPSSPIHCGHLPVAIRPLPGVLYDVTVSQSTSPELFQVVSYLQKGTYSTLLSEMTDYYSDPTNLTHITPDYLKLGAILAFRDCTTWHRVKIIRVVSLHPVAVALKLVDQGCFKACTSPDNLQPLRATFGQLPPQACAAELAGVEPWVGGWGADVLDWFKKATLGRDFVGRVEDIVHSAGREEVMVLELIDTSRPSIDMNVNNELRSLQSAWEAKVGLKQGIKI